MRRLAALWFPPLILTASFGLVSKSWATVNVSAVGALVADNCSLGAGDFDGVVESGEFINMLVSVQNITPCDEAATGVTVTAKTCHPRLVPPDCSAPNPWVTLTSNFFTVPDVACPGFRQSADPLDYAVSPCHPCGTGARIRFQFHIECQQSAPGQGCPRNVDFYVPVGDDPPHPDCDLPSPGHKCVSGTLGSCCVADLGRCATCARADCEIPDGCAGFGGAGTSCAANPCGFPVGACCNGSACTIRNPGSCSQGGGTYLGDGTCCTGNPCGASQCPVLAASITFPPVSPAKLGQWVYTSTCGRLDPAAPIATTPDGVGVRLPDPIDAPGGLLRLYQLDCSCSSRIFIIKELAAGRVRLEF